MNGGFVYFFLFLFFSPGLGLFKGGANGRWWCRWLGGGGNLYIHGRGKSSNHLLGFFSFKRSKRLRELVVGVFFCLVYVWEQGGLRREIVEA